MLLPQRQSHCYHFCRVNLRAGMGGKHAASNYSSLTSWMEGEALSTRTPGKALGHCLGPSPTHTRVHSTHTARKAGPNT
jgi:hypothetical protein